MKLIVRIIGLLILVLILSQLDLNEIWGILQSIKPFHFLSSFLLIIPLISLKSLRWRYILNLQGISYSYSDSIVTYFSSIYIGTITPGGLGEFVRPLYLKLDKSISISKGLSSVFADRFLDFYLLLIIGLFSLFIFSVDQDQLLLISIGLFVIAVIIPFVIIQLNLIDSLFLLFFRVFPVPKKLISSIQLFIDEFIYGLKKLVNIHIIYPIFLTVVAHSIFFYQCYLITQSLDISIPIIYVFAFMSLPSLIALIPISFSGIGSRDILLVYLFAQINLSAELAISYSTIYFVIFYLSTGLLGFIFFMYKPIKWK